MFDIRNARQYMEKLLWIRTKEGEEKRLKLKPAQDKLLRVVEDLERQGKPVRVIVLKARQEGISTMISGYIFSRCATRENRAAMLVAHKAEATANLHKMHLRFYDGLPAILRPMRAASNAIELVFANPSKDPVERAKEPGLRSRIRCATAGGEGVGRSDTLQYVHVSEYAFWPDGVNAKQDTLLGLLQAVPALPGTAVFIESTAKGFDDFHKRWADAVSGRSDFVPVFFSWAEEPEYRKPVPPGTVWTPEERELMRVHGLDQEQLVWRRWCIANNCNGDVQRFQQEYPLTPEEAFITSGACWFDTKVLFARLRELEENKKDVAHDVRRYGNENPDVAHDVRRYGNENPDVAHDVRRNRRGRFVYEKIWDQSLQRVTLSEIRFEEQEDGPVTIWRQPAERTPYVMGGDTAGEGSDWFSAYVIDNTDASMCARIWMQNDEAEYTAQFWCLGRYFNFALATPEVNFSTYPIRTLQEWGYPRLYVRQAEDDYTHKPRSAFGWRTDRLTRPAMLTELKEFTEAHPEAIVDEELLREMLVFCKNRDGRPEALTGEHDDLVMGYGITLRIRDQQSAAKEPEPGKAGRYTEDMLEDWRAASPEQRAYLERIWGRPF